MIGGMLTPTRFSSALDVDLLSTLFFNYLQFIYFKRGCPGLEKRVCYLFGGFLVFFPPGNSATHGCVGYCSSSLFK